MISRLLRLFGREKEFEGTTPDISGLLQVTSDATRCVQCGICGYNCPVGIEVREYARRGENVTDSRCIRCNACVEQCPRGTLKWGPAILVRADDTLQVDPDTLPTMLQLQPRKQDDWKST